MIRLLALDIDGVLTDGRVLIDESGHEAKFLSFRDIDAVFRARRHGLQVALITGEQGAMAQVIARRLEAEHLYEGAKDKRATLEQLAADLGIPLQAICYVGDSQRDAPAIAIVGLGCAPADAADEAREAAALALTSPGGRGAVEEVVRYILARQESA